MTGGGPRVLVIAPSEKVFRSVCAQLRVSPQRAVYVQHEIDLKGYHRDSKVYLVDRLSSLWDGREAHLDALEFEARVRYRVEEVTT